MPSLRLRSINGPRRGQEFVFSGPRVRIGRSRDNDLILPEHEQPTSSGHHAEALLDTSGAWSIIDAGSSNGTRINDVLVIRRELRNGDRLTLGDEQFAIAIGSPRSSSSRFLWPVISSIVAAALAVLAVVVIEQLRARPTFEEVAASAARSVFLIALDEDGRRSVVGTAFVVSPAVLATNAHVAHAIAGRASAAIQDTARQGRRIVGAMVHPDWRPGSLRADVALLRIEPGSDAPALTLADDDAIAALRRGAPVAAFGFPAVSTDAAQPRGRLSVDVVGDVRGNFFEVGLGIAPGTSGSPVFNQAGAVVAMVAGGDFVDAPNGEMQPSGTAVNWALSAALVRELLERNRRER